MPHARPGVFLACAVVATWIGACVAPKPLILPVAMPHHAAVTPALVLDGPERKQRTIVRGTVVSAWWTDVEGPGQVQRITFVGVDAPQGLVVLEQAGQPVAIPMLGVHTLWVHNLPERRGDAIGSGIVGGIFGGFALTFVPTLALTSHQSASAGTNAALLGLTVGAPLGALIGAVLGGYTAQAAEADSRYAIAPGRWQFAVGKGATGP